MRTRVWPAVLAATLLLTVAVPGGAASAAESNGSNGWSTPGPQVAQSGVLAPGEVVKATPGPVAADSRAPKRDAERCHARPARRSGPADPVAEPDVSDELGAPLPDPDDNPAPAPDDPERLSVFRNTTVPVTTGYTGATGEPSTDQNGRNIFATGNYHAEFSKDNGRDWTGLDPYAVFGPDFCCDQVSKYDPGRNRQYWLLQYLPQNLTGGHLTLAGTDGGDFVNWRPYKISATTFGRSADEDLDYNDLVVGTRYLYLTTRFIHFIPGDSYDIDAVGLVRISLDDLAHGRPAHWDAVTRTDITEQLRVPQGITDVAYAAATSLPSGQGRRMRLLVWPEDSQVVTTVDRRVPPFRYMSHDDASTEGHCESQDGVVNNWCSYNRSGSLWAARGGGYLWFAWGAQQWGGKRPFPYTRITRIREADLGVDGSHDLYGLTVAHLYAAIAPDGRGHIGLVDSFGGGTGDKHYFPSGMIGLFDDVSPVSPTVDYFLRGKGNGCLLAPQDESTAGNWGDYNTIRGWYTGNGVWNATTYVRNDDTPNNCPRPANVTIKNIAFGRERDRGDYDRFSRS